MDPFRALTAAEDKKRKVHKGGSGFHAFGLNSHLPSNNLILLRFASEPCESSSEEGLQEADPNSTESHSCSFKGSRSLSFIFRAFRAEL